MTTTAPRNWVEGNQQHLMARLGEVRTALARHTPGTEPEASADVTTLPHPAGDEIDWALDALSRTFHLSRFEEQLLLLCAGVELDAGFAALCANAHGDPSAPYATFSLALAALDQAHWSALTPSAPLRYWHLVEVAGGETLTRSPLRIDERVLHHLTGLAYLDARLESLVHPVNPAHEPTPSQRRIADRIVERWSASTEMPAPRALVQLLGEDHGAALLVAAQVCRQLGASLYVLDAADLPPALDRHTLARLWEREAVLARRVLAVHCSDDPHRRQGLDTFLDGLDAWTFVLAREPLRLASLQVIAHEIPRPDAAEQRVLWEAALGSEAGRLNGQLEQVISQFRLGVQGIRAAAGQLRAEESDASDALWNACRVQARLPLDGLAQRIEPAARWDDLILPEAQTRTLREIAAQVRHRYTVYETWGFVSKGARGLGITALFAGASGTGKTMAAEVLAAALNLDLFRIDLSQVVSRYLGETEKNLSAVFRAAEDSGAVLLFDEADALFGKRSDVKDSHDRYANIEVSYLLQRMEAYRGLAILTTNMKSLLDGAFLRRIRFTVDFPFPEPSARARIWERIFPSSLPCDGLDVERLANLNVAGGNIRNIALQGAFLAADAGEPLRMGHLLRAARSECAKLERTLTDAECRGWR